MLKFANPPRNPSGLGTFSDNLVGLQLTQGGGLTLGNFVSSNPPKEKVDRNFESGSFSEPFTLKTLEISSVEEAKQIFETNFKIYPNFDNTDINNFVGYGSLSKRFESSILNIINNFPAGIEVNRVRPNFKTGDTIMNPVFNLGGGTNGISYTTIEIDTSILKNPFSIDFSVYATENLKRLDYKVSYLRNFTENYKDYVVIVYDISDTQYNIIDFSPTTSLTSGTLTIKIEGNPFTNSPNTSTNRKRNFLIRPKDSIVNKVFNLDLDEVDEILLNRFSVPIYTSTFQIPQESNDGTFFIKNQTISFPLDGIWNLDISSIQFTKYISELQKIAENLDEFKTNILQRFYTTESIKEFDTFDQKVSKTLKLYGRSFDDTKKYINSISHSVSVNYNIKNDIASGFLPNLAKTLGWETNISPIQDNSFLSTLYDSFNSSFAGLEESFPLEELQNQYYRNLLLNTAYIFKSKGTRKSVEFLLKFVGAPEALIEFNENVYLVDNKFSIDRFNELYLTVVGGTFSPKLPTYDPTNVYRFFGTFYTGYTDSNDVQDVSISRVDYPVDDLGYPSAPQETDSMFFQKGAGWFESTTKHRSPETVDFLYSVFTGDTVNIQTKLESFSYGQKYLDIFRKFPYLGTGFGIRKMIDNKKSWTDRQVGLRKNTDSTFDAYYEISDDRLVLNVKNVDLFLNPAQAVSYDIWYLSNTKNYPIPFTGLSLPFPQTGGTDWTFINPQPQIEDFFEFSQTFWKNMINVRNRQQSSDGKTSGYPTLQSLFWKYLTMSQDVGITNNNFTYQNMINYINSIGSYWVNLVQQVIPATTIWNTGTKLENSIFHRQKFAYRPQRGCGTIESELRGPQAGGGAYPNNCGTSDVTIDLSYNLNLITTALSSVANQNTCQNGQGATIQSLKYKFTLNITKGASNISLSYTDTSLRNFPNVTMTDTQWNTFITNGLSNLSSSFTANSLGYSIPIANDLKIVLFESTDCSQIEIVEFNLEFTQITLTCF